MSKQPKFAQNKLYQYWQAEAVRLYESKHGHFDENNIRSLIINKYKGLNQRILYRANLIAKQEKIDQKLDKWLFSAKISILILWLLAFLSGIGVAAGALANPQINLASALIAILGLHLITFIIWLTTYLPISKPGTGLSSIWLWLNKRIGPKDQEALATKSFLSLLMRQKMWPSTIGIITHSTWVSAFVGALLTLLVLLSTRNYSFHWATTLLSNETIINLSQIIGSMPAILGFPMPDNTAINYSLTNIDPGRNIQSQWSVWLIGCVIVWGLIPRLIALFICLFKLLSQIARLNINPDLPAWLELKNIYMPRQQSLGIDKPADKISKIFKPNRLKGLGANKLAILGYELDPDYEWPPSEIQSSVIDLGVCASRTDQNRIRKLLNKNTNLLIVCNTALTPDRGTINWLHELQDLSANLSIYCPIDTRIKLWQEMLFQQGFLQIDSIKQWQTEILEAS